MGGAIYGDQEDGKKNLRVYSQRDKVGDVY